MRWAALAVVVSATAFATSVSSGSVVSSPAATASTTSGAMDLGVNPDGGQSSGCVSDATASGDCRVIQNAIDSVPKGLQNLVVVRVDAGTYTENIILSGFRAWVLDAGTNTATLPMLVIQGSQNYNAITPATGTATGTATAYVAESGTTKTLLTDTGQGWPDGGLVGHYIKTSLSSSVAVPIIANNGNTMTLERTVGSVVAGVTTYTVCDPSTVIVSAGTTLNAISIKGTDTPILLNDLRVESGVSAGNGWVNLNDFGAGYSASGGVQMNRVQFVNTVAAAPTLLVSRPRAGLTLADVIFDSVRSGVVTASGPSGSTMSFAGYARTANASSAAFSLSLGDYRFNNFTIDTAGTGAPGVQITTTGVGTVNVDATSLRVQCPASSTAPAVFATGQSGNMPAIPVIRWSPTTFASIGCLGGVSLKASAIWNPINSGTSLINATGSSGTSYGYALAAGAQGFFPADVHTFTFTGVTNEITLDGTVYTRAQVGTSAIYAQPYGTAALSGASVAGPQVIGQYFQLAKPTIGTCSSTLEGSVVRQKGGSSEGYTKQCVCVSDGAASPAYQWCSTQYAAGAATTTCTGGSTTVCP